MRKEARDIHGTIEHCLDNVMPNNNTANNHTNAYSSVNFAPQFNQNRAELRTALNNPSNTVTGPKHLYNL